MTVRPYFLRLDHKIVSMRCAAVTIKIETHDSLRTLKQLHRTPVYKLFLQFTATQSVTPPMVLLALSSCYGIHHTDNLAVLLVLLKVAV